MALTAEEFFSGEAEELEILRCRHLREHYANYPIGLCFEEYIVGHHYIVPVRFEEYFLRL